MLPDAESTPCQSTLQPRSDPGSSQRPMQLHSTLNLQQLQCMHSGSKAKVSVTAQVSYVLLEATSISMVNVKLKVKSARSVAK